MNKFYLTGALLASTLAIAACNKAATTNNAAAPAAGNTAAPAAPAAPAGGNTAGGEGAAPAGDQTNQNFTLTNNTGHVVTTLNVSPSNSDQWGPDILGRDVLANGESASITFPRAETACEWDIKATYDDGDTTDARGVNLCTTTTVTLTSH